MTRPANRSRCPGMRELGRNRPTGSASRSNTTAAGRAGRHRSRPADAQREQGRRLRKTPTHLTSGVEKLSRRVARRCKAPYSGYATHRDTTVRMFQAADVVLLTGLTVSQLREWSSSRRRNLIPADVDAAGPGRHALYSWQTILVLRVLRELRDDFAVDLGAWAPGMVELREQLQGLSFPSLWGTLLTFPSKHSPPLLSAQTPVFSTGLVIPLDPHLLPIATKLSLPSPDQLFLFPVVGVK